MRLIIITGAPASGKSSIAEMVGRKLSIDVISKDGYKIELFEKYGFTNHAEKKKLSIRGEQMMNDSIRKHIEQNKDIIVDNNFKDFDDVRKAIDDNMTIVKVICILCKADYDILAKRYNDRIQSGNRHLALYTLNQYPVIEGVSEFHPIIDRDDVDRIEQNIKEQTFGDNVLEINTDHIEEEYDSICNEVIAYIRAVDNFDKPL